MAGIDKGNSFRKELRGRMRKLGQPATILGLLLTMLASATAFGEDMVAIRISDDGTDDIVATVYDLDAKPPVAVVVRRRINGFAWIPASVTAGATGTGHVRWTATSAEARWYRCGHNDKRGLGNDDSVRVFSDSPCVAKASRPAPATHRMQAIDEILERNIDTPIGPEFMAPPLRTVGACETSRPSIPTATTA
jgi:hypothetical protein